MSLTLPKTIYAPFTRAQVRNIRAHQERDDVHPFTCGTHSDTPLLVTKDHLFCAHCDYTQTWVHWFMAKRSRT